MLKMLTRLFDPLEGTIRIDGYDIPKVDFIPAQPGWSSASGQPFI